MQRNDFAVFANPQKIKHGRQIKFSCPQQSDDWMQLLRQRQKLHISTNIETTSS
jgi:hypothetical protein